MICNILRPFIHSPLLLLLHADLNNAHYLLHRAAAAWVYYVLLLLPRAGAAAWTHSLCMLIIIVLIVCVSIFMVDPSTAAVRKCLKNCQWNQHGSKIPLSWDTLQVKGMFFSRIFYSKNAKSSIFLFSRVRKNLRFSAKIWNFVGWQVKCHILWVILLNLSI